MANKSSPSWMAARAVRAAGGDGRTGDEEKLGVGFNLKGFTVHATPFEASCKGESPNLTTRLHS